MSAGFNKSGWSCVVDKLHLVDYVSNHDVNKGHLLVGGGLFDAINNEPVCVALHFLLIDMAQGGVV